ncbi:MAG: hypothetical protein KAH07_00550 [Flavobacteriaceae bacterium]|nr:hypothetical protein [Flavobacteriaceae bacterium]
MSTAGVGNVLAANLIYDLGKGWLKSGQKEENKPLTKGDLFQAINILVKTQNEF